MMAEIDVLHFLSGAIWRLLNKKYLVQNDMLDDEELAECDHLMTILNESVEQARKIIKAQHE